MSEITHYYGVTKEPLEEIKSKLEKANILSAVDDGSCKDTDNWVAILAPLIMGFKVPGDFSTFSIVSNPWENLKKTFPKIIELYVEENQTDWVLTTSLFGVEKKFEFNKNFTTNISSEDREYISKLFSIPFEELEPALKADKVSLFCDKILLPYCEIVDQDQFSDVIPRFGKVVFTTQFDD